MKWVRVFGPFIAWGVRLFGLLLAWLFSTLMLATWIQAAIHPSHRITIAVDEYGELWFEWIVVPLAWAICTFGIAATLYRERRRT